jgi:class 3 adenylate cyclase/tRNA A-37 threonylcarbamoyl transferase component Bud32/tetratricopeptide (TPR) repeat protein
LAADLPQIPGMEPCQELLGKGAFASVYRARRNGVDYAVKLGHDHRSEEADLRLRREAALLARIRHPAVVRVHASGRLGKRPYLVMDLVRGNTVAKLLERGPLIEEQTVAIGVAVAGALAAAHRLGAVHQDVKPENVVVAPEGVKLIDFGLAQRTLSQRDDSVVGSVLYAAPEQTRMLRRPIDGRSDLYALGGVLFACVTGRPPFEAEKAEQLLKLHAAAPVPSVLELRPNAHPMLSAIIGKLLAKDPDDRYQTAGALMQDLLRLKGTSEAFTLGVGDSNATKLTFDAPLVGRGAELDRLTTWWSNEVRKGNGGLAFIEGAPGAGKSRLVREVLARAVADRALIMEGKCAAGGATAFGPLREALNDHLRSLERLPPGGREAEQQRIREAAGESAGLLKGFSPLLGHLLDRIPAVASTHEDQFYEALVSLFTRLSSSSGGAAVFIDDVQWVDEGTRQVLTRLSRRADQCPLLLVTASRNDPGSVEGRNRFFTELQGSIKEHVSLQTLDEAATETLISQLVGGEGVSHEVLGQISRRAQGSPFAAGEYVRAAQDAEVLELDWGTWSAREGAFERLALPQDVLELISRRIDGLDERVRRLLSVAAAQGTRFDPRLLAMVAGIDPAEVDLTIGQALGAHVIERVGSARYMFVHDRIQESLLAGLSAEALRTIHQQTAESMEGEREDSPEYVYALAQHYIRGHVEQHRARLFEATTAAGQCALKDHAPGEAIVYFKHALEAAAAINIVVSADAREDIAEAFFRAGNIAEAIVHLRTAIDEQAPGSLRRIRTWIHYVRVLTGGWRMDLIDDAFQSAFRELGVISPARLSLGNVLSTLGAWAMWLTASRLGLRLGGVSGEKKERIKAFVELTWLTGYSSAYRLRMHVLVLTLLRKLWAAYRLGPSRELARAYGDYGVVLGELGVAKAAERSAEKSRAMYEQLGDQIGLANQHTFHGVIKTFYGDIAGAQKQLERAIGDFGTWLEPGEVNNAFGQLMTDLPARGCFREALQVLEALERDTRITTIDDDGEVQHLWMGNAALCHAMMGNARRALSYLERGKKVYLMPSAAPFTRGQYLMNAAATYVELEGHDAELEDLFTEWDRIITAPPFLLFVFLRTFYVYRVMTRLRQFRAAAGDEKRLRRKQLEKALFTLKLSARPPWVKQYALVYQAAYDVQRCRWAAADRRLKAAEVLAERTLSPQVFYEIAVQRALIAQACGRAEATALHAYAAHGIAQRNGWVGRARRVLADFGLEALGQNRSSTISPTSSGARRPDQLQRHLDALLQVSLASARELDPDRQARNALDEVVRLLGAERAFLFMLDDHDQLLLRAGRDTMGNDLSELSAHSATVVTRVRASKSAVVVSGLEEGHRLGAESVVVHGIRSIIAVPLSFNERFLGVLYLDNHFAKGVFTEDDVHFLLAIGNHIAIAQETARIAGLEADRKALEKSEQLLLAILPRGVADELKAEGKVKPRRYEIGTVLFTDFQGFTTYSERVTPDDLLGELDDCYTAFDDIVARHGLERLKTMGDSYMCVSGIPVPTPGHARNAMAAVLAMKRVIDARRVAAQAAGREYWRLRVGVFSGPVIAGVVGKSKFAYDVWGDTVNCASRLEQLNKDYGTSILVGALTRALAEPDFVFRRVGREVLRGRSVTEDISELLGSREELGGVPPWVTHFEQGLSHCEGGRWEQSAASLRQVLRAEPNDERTLYLLKKVETTIVLSGERPT